MSTVTKQKLGLNQSLLVDALRSDKYTQAREQLQCPDGHCGLGVACEVAAAWGVEVRRDESGRLLGVGLEDQPGVEEFFEFSVPGESLIVQFNDHDKYTLDEIADQLEEHPGQYFEMEK